MRRIWIILVCILIVILLWMFTRRWTCQRSRLCSSLFMIKERFDVPIRHSTQNHKVIRNSERYILESNTTYYFDLKEDNSYLLPGRPRDDISLEFPESPEDGDVIILIDKNDRFGWGNHSYDFKLVLRDHMIRGDLSSKNLFPYRGGYVMFVWNEKENAWESNGYKGEIQNVWNGWYRLVYKGFNTSSDTSTFPSYMRIDATQFPILVTYYGGTDMYPINLVIDSDIAELSKDEKELIIPTYPSRLGSVMNARVPVLRRLRNGIVIDFDKGGGWKKDERLRLNENPSDLHDLN